MPDILALVDCNNFYASCERLFLPSLEKKPMVVLSNNDGCIIARSQEAKLLGIGMGIPIFEVEDLIKENNVHIFSTNYALYGDISRRVMNVLADCVPEIEIYSIDEAFIDVSHVSHLDLDCFCRDLGKSVLKNTGIPVSIGVATTKTLAKAANHMAKANPSMGGVMNFVNNPCLDDLLHKIPVQDIWGIGEKYNDFFLRSGVVSALDLKNTDEYHVRNHLGIVGQRLVRELNGLLCYGLDENPDSKKEICTSRSFGYPVEKMEDLEEATTTYASSVARKLRLQGSLAQKIMVFVMTNKFAAGPQYVNYKILQLPVPTNQTHQLIHYSRSLLKALYQKGYRYKKTGVIVSDLVPDHEVQTALWEDVRSVRLNKLSDVMDRVNTNSGKDTLKFAVQGSGKTWKMKQNNLSPKYTTNWNDLLTVNMDRNG